jgi:hypothetical protein
MRLLVVLAAAAAAAAALPAAAAPAAAAPTMIHTSQELQQALSNVNVQGGRPRVVVASGDAHCQDTLQQLGLLDAVRSQEGLGLLLLSPESSPELQAKINLTKCHDLAFIDPAYAEVAAAVAAVAIDTQGTDEAEVRDATCVL